MYGTDHLAACMVCAHTVKTIICCQTCYNAEYSTAYPVMNDMCALLLTAAIHCPCKHKAIYGPGELCHL